jgi:hypothetical protein
MRVTNRGFHVRNIRRSSRNPVRDTVLGIHQKRVQEMKDLSGNPDTEKLSEYYLENGELLMNYYDLIQGNSTVQNSASHTQNTSVGPSILDFMNSGNPSPAPDKNTSALNKEEIYERYQMNVNPSYVPEKYLQKSSDIRKCTFCSSDMVLIPSNAIAFCENCGREESVLLDIDLPGVKDQNKDTTYFNYRKINHFNEWLAQFQAKETTDIPQEVYDKILLEFRKERKRDISNLTPKKLRTILKRLGLNKFYEHIPHIINRLNGIPPPRLSPETEEILRRMFREIQTPFIKHCPAWRKNFLSYSYVLHKFCLILDKREFLPCFPLLKSREKLYDMDKVWKKICDELGWPFHRSI